ncbi:hypothetical protein P7228_05965 [Altererythrobacter arenosus]|uniref:Uncharacterized protein n=1 Tax=Altererythrobacter arenosus TaxID=3032592 RepID=A0ABY8FZ70_9SPHN|nr:hypothetical protein [Altererythrobacter sp. CAU 1644]WFL78606.1 hypothetical protein P7228_05965 [Altererythrobacter sp. CAU 1644]
MIPGLNDVMSPDMQKILLFVLPLLAALGTLVLTLSRGKSTEGVVAIVVLTAVAIYFAPGFMSVF